MFDGYMDKHDVFVFFFHYENKYIENFTTKKWKLSYEKSLVVFIFLLKT